MRKKEIETIQTLIATKNQDDYSIIRKMNISTDCIMANSTEDNISTGETVIDGNNVLVVNSTAKSIGAVRNIALKYATADCVLFADDNVVYTDDVKEKILDAFSAFKSADVIIFSSEENSDISTLISQRAERRHIFNSLKYPTYIIAARRMSLVKRKIRFSELFGEGCHYEIGNDTKFLADCFKKGLTVYSHCYKIASKYFEETAENSSSDDGLSDKFFFDKGAIYASIFGPFSYFAIMHFAKKYCEECNMSMEKIKSHMLNGAEDYRTKKNENRFNVRGR